MDARIYTATSAQLIPHRAQARQGIIASDLPHWYCWIALRRTRDRKIRMVSSDCLSDAFFMNVGFLNDEEILILASASTEIRNRVDDSRCSSIPIQLLPGVGIYGLWNHFELWQVAMYLR